MWPLVARAKNVDVAIVLVAGQSSQYPATAAAPPLIAESRQVRAAANDDGRRRAGVAVFRIVDRAGGWGGLAWLRLPLAYSMGATSLFNEAKAPGRKARGCVRQGKRAGATARPLVCARSGGKTKARRHARTPGGGPGPQLTRLTFSPGLAAGLQHGLLFA